MEVKSFKFSKNNEIQSQWEKVFNILDKKGDSETLLMMVLINKSLEEVCGRRIEVDDFFHEEQMLEAIPATVPKQPLLFCPIEGEAFTQAS